MTEQPEMESAVSEPPITEGDGSERRRHVRMPVHWTGALAGESDALDCVVLDISPGGARVQSADPLPVVTEVRLSLAHGGDYQGAVVWRQGSFMGLRFAGQEPIAA